jgi:hypothetical protein
VSAALHPEAAAVLALLALVLLPGLLVVRAPWTVVPALSVAFWTLSWWWLPVASRAAGVRYALLGFGVLAVLRLLPRHQVPPPPDYEGPPPLPLVKGPTTGHAPSLRRVPALVVTAVAAALAVPLPLWPHVPGAEMAFHTTSTRLLLWRDAVPATYGPLLPLGSFGSHAPALPTLAADIAHLSGLDPGRAVVVAAQLSGALLLLGTFALLATRTRPAAAMLAALLGLAGAPWPRFLEVWGEGGPTLALALGVSAAALLIGHTSRPSAVAAGLLLGAALLAQPVLTVGLGLALALGSRPGARSRLGLSSAVAVVLAAPGLLRLGRAVSLREVVGTLEAVSVTGLLRFATGLGLFALAIFVAHRLSGSGTRPRALIGALIAVSAAVLLLRVHLGPAAGQLDPAARRALTKLDGQGHPTEAICGPPALIDWVPALGGRPPGVPSRDDPGPWIPHVLQEEWDGALPRQCSRTLDLGAGRKSTSFDVP